MIYQQCIFFSFFISSNWATCYSFGFVSAATGILLCKLLPLSIVSFCNRGHHPLLVSAATGSSSVSPSLSPLSLPVILAITRFSLLLNCYPLIRSFQSFFPSLLSAFSIFAPLVFRFLLNLFFPMTSGCFKTTLTNVLPCSFISVFILDQMQVKSWKDAGLFSLVLLRCYHCYLLSLILIPPTFTLTATLVPIVATGMYWYYC